MTRTLFRGGADGDPLDVATFGQRVRAVYLDRVLVSSGRPPEESS